MSIPEHAYNPDDFANLRHIGPSERDLSEMVRELGFGSEEELVAAALPQSLGPVSLERLGPPADRAAGTGTDQGNRR